MTERKNTFVIEIITLGIYLVSLSIISFFHEPWFDEAQAWLIARDNSIFKIVLHILRYEGHTPLWYICLYVPAHLGLPFEFSIKLINIIFSSIAAYFIIRKSPFHLIIRLLLPFTFFLFYQYGVISRSYSLLSLLLCLTAVTFPYRNKYPFRLTLLLILLGGTIAHGMLIGCGIAVAWFFEIINNHYNKKHEFIYNTKKVVLDKRFFAIMLIAFTNLIYVVLLWPMPDKLTPLQISNFNMNDFFFRMFVVPLNGVVNDVWPNPLVQFDVFPIIMTFLGIILTSASTIWVLNKGTYLYVILPYMFTAIFMSSIYFARPHTGIYTLMIIFGIWICLYDEKIFQIPHWSHRICMTVSNAITNQKVIKNLLFFCVIFIFYTQIIWSISASINEIKFDYYPSKKVASFIKQNNIVSKKIFNGYMIVKGKPVYSMQDITPLAYFDKNIFYNNNYGKIGMSYVTHKLLDDAYTLNYFKSMGEPEFVIEYDYPLLLYKNIFTPEDYILTAEFKSHFIWKDSIENKVCKIYVRKDLSSKISLTK